MSDRKIKNTLLNFNYPQRVFGKTVVDYIHKQNRTPALIIDCPCGNGETTWHISKINTKVFAADISAKAIELAVQNFQSPNIEFAGADIFSAIDRIENNTVFCLINSLFLFPNAVDVLKALQTKMLKGNSKLLLIVPNVNGENFRWFQKNHPDENKSVLSFEELKPFFEKLNFKVEIIQPICYTHHFNRFDTKFASVLWGLYLNAINKLQTLLKIGKANYFFIALTA